MTNAKLGARLVKPDATAEEVRAVVNDDQGGQIFSQAVSCKGNYQWDWFTDDQIVVEL